MMHSSGYGRTWTATYRSSRISMTFCGNDVVNSVQDESDNLFYWGGKEASVLLWLAH
jgi:hypothetical protein